MDRYDDQAQNSRNVETRKVLANLIGTALREEVSPIRIWHTSDHVGPMGGVQEQIVVALESEGQVVAAIIAVYSDDRCQAVMDSLLDRDRVNHERRERLGW